MFLQKFIKNLTQSRKERQEKYGVTTLRALREKYNLFAPIYRGAALGIIQIDTEYGVKKMRTEKSNTVQLEAGEHVKQKKRLKKLTNNSETRFRIFFESSPDGIYVTNLEGKILDVNLAASLLHEMGKGELIGRNMLDLIHANNREQVIEDFPKWLSGKINYYETNTI